MKVLKIKATLRDSAPLVWRTLYFHPETGLEQVSDMLLVATGWDEENPPFFISNDGPINQEDDPWFEANLNDYLTKPGDIFSYSKESDDEYHIELELVSTEEVPDEEQLPRIIAGANQAPPEDIGGLEAYTQHLTALADSKHPGYKAAADQLGTAWDPTALNIEALNIEAYDLFEGDFEEMDLEFFNVDDDDYSDQNFMIDVDAHQEIPFQFDWMEKVHGLKLSAEDVRNVPQELHDFREAFNESDLNDPGRYLPKVEAMLKKFPNDPMLMLDAASLYIMTGKMPKGRRLIAKIDREHSGNLEYTVSKLMALEDNDVFLAEVSRLKQPLDIRNFTAGKEGRYHVLEFLLFEEMAIRKAVVENKLVEAMERLDRLVRFGFLHGDVGHSALGISYLQLVQIEEMQRTNKLHPDADRQPELSARTQEILDVSMQEALVNVRNENNTAARREAPVVRIGPKVGRNDPCPCGSGKKYKKCCR
jgi:hypothetical protein